jgi:hypothetical protein
MPKYPALTEGVYAGGHLVSDEDANGHRSRETIVIGSGAALVAGTVLGRLLSGAATSAVKASGANTGNATMSAVTVLPGAKDGAYTVRMLTATTFRVEDPAGDVIGEGATGAAFADDIGFTMTAGGTPMVAGDGFDVAVSVTGGKYKILAPAATDGTQIAAGILYGPAAAATADVRGVANVRESVVNAAELTWPVGITTNQKNAAIAQLAALQIILR